MRQIRKIGSCLGIVLMLAGCSSVEELFDEPIEPSPAAASTSGDSRSLARIGDDGTPQTPPPVSVSSPPQFQRGQTTPTPTPTGTFVGKKALQISGDFDTLRQAVDTHGAQFQQSRANTRKLAEEFHTVVASINTKLQIGTTPGNPLLGQQWAEAQSKLSAVSDNVLRLEELRGRVATDAALAGFLLEQVQAAYSLSGAVDEDHQQLARLEDDINRTSVTVERLLSQIDQDVARQSAYVTRQRRNLTTLALAIKSGELYGPNLMSRTSADTGNAAAAASPTSRRAAITAQSRTAAASRQSAPKSVNAAAARASAAQRTEQPPILVVNFDAANVAYESNLYAAVSDVIARRPGASFKVVGLSPSAGGSSTKARRNAQRVLRSMVNMGVPESRLQDEAKASPSVSGQQVLVYAL